MTSSLIRMPLRVWSWLRDLNSTVNLTDDEHGERNAETLRRMVLLAVQLAAIILALIAYMLSVMFWQSATKSPVPVPESPWVPFWSDWAASTWLQGIMALCAIVSTISMTFFGWRTYIREEHLYRLRMADREREGKGR